MNRYILAGIALIFALVCAAHAEVPRVLHYQGTLLNADGQAIHCPDDGTCEATFNITFRIYAEETGGDMLYEQTGTSIKAEGSKVLLRLAPHCFHLPGRAFLLRPRSATRPTVNAATPRRHPVA